ncbi:hypothetical protein Pcinc_023546 [Petrolisthes cinctipes]|uniref:Uncharacterized protein n=1 Tax=Petrolisthes cinctipes TaxID=88211 RepID=A0AAE1FCB2_PETCI|nr:hypothetical protein Pcinc_023546 [Petrolisthes cinctipes]
MAVADDSAIEKVYLDGEAIEVVEKFCYLGDTIGAQGGAGAGVMARVRRGWRLDPNSFQIRRFSYSRSKTIATTVANTCVVCGDPGYNRMA